MSISKKLYLVLLIFSVVLLLIWFFFLNPFLSSIKKGSREIKAAANSLILLDKRYQDFQSFKEQTAKVQPVFDKMNDSLVNHGAPIKFAEFLEKEAQEIGISLKISKILPRQQESIFWGSIQFNLSLSGSFPRCLVFLKKLELSSYLIKIIDINISKPSKREMTGNLQPGDVTINVTTEVYSK